MHSRPNDERGFIHKRILGGIGGFIKGGPISGLAGFVTGGGRSRTTLRRQIRRAPRQTALVPTRGVRGFVQRLIPGGRTGFEQVTRGETQQQRNTRIQREAAQRAAEARQQGASPAQAQQVAVQAAAAEGVAFKRRRMNVVNPKALRRAARRVNGFVKVATRALEGTGWKVVRRTSTKRGKPRTIIESGPGSVVL